MLKTLVLKTLVRKRRRGFSLIELLVVLVILALLAGIVLPKLLDQQKKGARGAAVTQVSSFKSAIQLYMLDHNSQPPKDLSELVSGDKKYLTDVSAVPKDPWGNDYVYESPGPNGEDFVVTSYAADGKPGGTGEWDVDITSTQTNGDGK
jgi:general secretion pathway protein G